MDTVQTPPKFTEDKITNLDYTADVTGSLPIIENIGDTLKYTVTGIPSTTSTSITHGAVTVWSTTTLIGTAVTKDVSVTKIGASTFLVIVDNTVTEDTTNDYSSSSITTTLTPVQASAKHLLIGA